MWMDHHLSMWKWLNLFFDDTRLSIRPWHMFEFVITTPPTQLISWTAFWRYSVTIQVLKCAFPATMWQEIWVSSPLSVFSPNMVNSISPKLYVCGFLLKVRARGPPTSNVTIMRSDNYTSTCVILCSTECTPATTIMLTSDKNSTTCWNCHCIYSCIAFYMYNTCIFYRYNTCKFFMYV